jgi:hypothetical protein
MKIWRVENNFATYARADVSTIDVRAETIPEALEKAWEKFQRLGVRVTWFPTKVTLLTQVD